MKWKFTSMNWLRAFCSQTCESDAELIGKMHELIFIYPELFGIKAANN
jgi:hypothetical protein